MPGRLSSSPALCDPYVVPDEAWLEGCAFELLRRENDLTWFTIHDPRSDSRWLAARAPIQRPDVGKRLERDFHLRPDSDRATPVSG